jgi:hypothetical protein
MRKVKPMKKTVSLLALTLALLCLATLVSCDKPPPETETPKTFGPAVFKSERNLVNSILLYGSGETHGNNLSALKEYYVPQDGVDSITVTEETVRIDYTPMFWDGPGKASLEWAREGDAGRLLEEKIPKLGLVEYAPGLYIRDAIIETDSGDVAAKSLYWVADGYLFHHTLPLDVFQQIEESGRAVTKLTTVSKCEVTLKDFAPEEIWLEAEIEYEEPIKGLWTMAELSMGYSFPEYLNSEFLYDNLMFLDFAGGRNLTAEEFISFRDRTIVEEGDLNSNALYLKECIVDENNTFIHEAEGSVFVWGPVYADLNRDGAEEVCYLLHSHTGSEFARLLVYEKTPLGYAERLCLWTGRDTLYLVEREGFVCLASAGPDYGKEEWIRYDEEGRGLVTAAEIRLIAFQEDWTAQVMCVSGGEIRPLSENSVVNYLFDEGRLQLAPYSYKGSG